MTDDPDADGRPERDRVIVERVEHAPTPPVAVQGTVIRQPVAYGPRPVDTARRLVSLLFGVLQAMIAMRIILLLLGADERNDLVGLIVGVSDPFVEPFRGMSSLDEVSGASGSVLDVAALVALVAWTLVEALVLGILGLADRRTTVA